MKDLARFFRELEDYVHVEDYRRVRARRIYETVMDDYVQLRAAVEIVVTRMIRSSRGTMITLTTKRLCQILGLPHYPALCSVLSAILRELGFKVERRRKRGTLFYITCEAPLWRKVKAEAAKVAA